MRSDEERAKLKKQLQERAKRTQEQFLQDLPLDDDPLEACPACAVGYAWRNIQCKLCKNSRVVATSTAVEWSLLTRNDNDDHRG